MEKLFQDAPYSQECESIVTAVGPDGIRLDRTVFYPMGGGQPGDSGTLTLPDGRDLPIADTRKAEEDDDIVHVPGNDAGDLPAVGTKVTVRIDWERRHRHMRMHTTLHLLCSLVDGEVTGGQIAADKSRLDFNIPGSAVDKQLLTQELNRLIAEDHPVGTRWVADAELDANPDLVRTMSVQPPRGSGQVRLLEIAGVDLQPCGGTHVASTGEIGAVDVTKIENKGRQNRRIVVALRD